MDHKVLLLLASMLVAAPPLSAQENDPSQPLSGFTLTSWTDANGLRLGAVYSIAQDLDGYLWIGAETGLLRFDGLRFSSWNVVSDAPLRDTGVSAVCVSRDGSVWFAMSDGGGVYRIRNGQQERLDDRRRSLSSITGLVEDRTGSIVAVTENGLWTFREGGWTPLAGGLPPTGILSAYVRRSGALLVGATRGLFRQIDGSEAFEPVASWWSFAISEDPQGVVWTTDIRTGFRRVGAEDQDPPRGNGYRLVHDRQGNLWVGTHGQGLWRVHRGDHNTTVESAAGLLADSVLALYQDREGNIWVGTTGGLHRLMRRKFTPLDVRFVVATESTWDDVWAGTWQGLVRLSQRDRQWLAGPYSATDHWILALHRDAQGTLWVGSDQGLSRLVDGRLESVVPRRETSAPIWSIASDSQRRLWVAAENGLFRLHGRTLIPFRHGDGMLRGVRQIYGDRQGRLWIIFDRGHRLAVLGPDGVLDPIVPDKSAVPEKALPIHHIFEDRAGIIWIGSSGGLIRFEHGRYELMNKSNGLPGDRVWAIVEDDEGYLWLNVALGIVRVSPDEFARAASDPEHRIRYQFYDAADGLAGAPLRNVRASRAYDGTLWFVRGGGLTVIDPRTVQLDTTSIGPVRIETASTGSGTVNAVPGTRLPAGTKRLEINYTAVTLTSPTKVHFRYRLDGFDADWIDAGPRREAVYTNLPPRQYRFLVEATSIEGVWSESTASWAFTIAPMFYETAWFYASGVLVAFVVTYGTWWLRLRLFRKQFAAVLAERTRLSHEIHDTLLQGVTGVALQLEHMYSNLDSLPRRSLKTLLLRTGQQIQAQIREARGSIGALRSPTLENRDVATALRDFGNRATADTAIRFTATVTGTPRRYQAALENQILRIGQEAILNAVRHAHATNIDLRLRFDDRSIGLRVHDDGCGFDAAHSTESVDGNYGLKTMQERAERVGGRLTILTARGGGTTIEATIPTRDSALAAGS